MMAYFYRLWYITGSYLDTADEVSQLLGVAQSIAFSIQISHGLGREQEVLTASQLDTYQKACQPQLQALH